MDKIGTACGLFSAFLAVGGLATINSRRSNSQRLIETAGGFAALATLFGLLIRDSNLRLFAALYTFVGFTCLIYGRDLLIKQSKRWIHRFAIYTGMGGTFSLVGSTISCGDVLSGLGGRYTAPIVVGGVLSLFGMMGTSIAKNLIVATAKRSHPDYDPSSGRDPWEL